MLESLRSRAQSKHLAIKLHANPTFVINFSRCGNGHSLRNALTAVGKRPKIAFELSLCVTPLASFD
jgi:hypothetical protein